MRYRPLGFFYMHGKAGKVKVIPNHMPYPYIFPKKLYIFSVEALLGGGLCSLTYNSVSIPTPWAVAGPNGQLASGIFYSKCRRLAGRVLS